MGVTRMKKTSRAILAAIAVSALMGCSFSESEETDAFSHDALRHEFLNPPSSSRPRTWFHVMSGNMTKAGITKDMEAIHAVGLGGVLLFNVTQGIPIGPVKFNSPEHIELIRHMASEAERLELSFGVHNCDGWTSSGGPWITPDISMKKVVWSETFAVGGAVDIVLPQPDSFENYYEDIATIAYPALPGELENKANLPTITSSQSGLDVGLITDGVVSQLRATALLEGTEESPGRLDIEYAKPFPLQTINLRFENQRLANVLLLSSQDGVTYEPVKHLALRRPGKDDWGNDEALAAPVTARYFRLETKVPLALKELKLSAVPSIGNMWGRTGAARTTYGKLPPIGGADTASIIKSDTVIDLSSYVDGAGRLKADLPEGDWTIMRFGQTSTGAWNLPASKEGIGLEVDKFSQAAVKVHYDAYMTNVVNAVKTVAPNAHQYTQIDSYEVGAQNWTTGYEAIFETEKNYSLVPFLPLFAGRFVDSSEASERVTWDMRDLSNSLMRENYYGYFTKLANADGLDVYIEPYGDGPFNEVDAGGKADIPMGEFWVNRFGNRVNASVSAANIYGKPIVSAEAFTDIWDVNWNFHPAYAKTIGDANWALGVNEFMFHRFAHQANTHVRPGMTMNRWGSHFDRTQTWWDSAGAEYFTYISRGQHLLRQGIPVNDALLFLGDGAPTTCPERETSNTIPRSLNFVCLNADVLQNRLSVTEEGFALPEGGVHKFLILQDSQAMTQASLDALDSLSTIGNGIIVGDPPQNLAGFAQTSKHREAFAAQVKDIWARDTVVTQQDVETQGWSSFLTRIGHKADLEIEGNPEALFAHRMAGNKDIYFLYNSTKSAQDITARFRVSGKNVSLWDPQTGLVRGVDSYAAEEDVTVVNFNLKAEDSVFVVFNGDKPLGGTVLSRQLSEVARQSISSPWIVSFNSEYGTDKSIVMQALMDWKDFEDTDIKHYSGPALYETQFDVTAAFLDSGETFSLDLGDVQIAATIHINGKTASTLWKPPFQIDISEHLQGGQNDLKVEVVNLWPNRLIGDAALKDVDNFTPEADWVPKTKMPDWYSQNEPPVLGERLTFTTADFYKASDDLLPSGLIGPVSLIAESSK